MLSSFSIKKIIYALETPEPPRTSTVDNVSAIVVNFPEQRRQKYAR